MIYFFLFAMTKKEYLIKLLSSLSLEVFPTRDNLLSLLNQTTLDENLLAILFDMFAWYVQQTNDSSNKLKLEKSIQFVQKLKSIEAEDQIKDQKDIDDLDKLLNTI